MAAEHVTALEPEQQVLAARLDRLEEAAVQALGDSGRARPRIRRLDGHALADERLKTAGGAVQGIAQALYEEVVYDEDTGQLKTGTMIDYLLPGIGEIPPLSLDHTVTPSPTNSLGVKGIGEAGTIAASAAVINAICDALSPLGIKHVDMPATPDKLWHMMKGASK